MEEKCKNCYYLKEEKAFCSSTHDYSGGCEVELVCTNPLSYSDGHLVDYNHTCYAFIAYNIS